MGTLVVMKLLLTSKGEEIKVDDVDYVKASRYTWRLDKNGYAVAGGGQRMPSYKLHRFIMSPEANQVVDHIDHDLRNNQRSNLRICTRAENQANQQKQKRDTSSKYKGVYFAKKAGKWYAQIKKNKKTMYLGGYSTQEEAAKAYNNKAKELFGEFAKLN